MNTLRYKDLGLYLVCIVLTLIAYPKPSKKYHKIPKKDRIDLAMDQELIMTQSPDLDRIDKSVLLDAQKFLKNINEGENHNANLIWQERGPINVGGRTRALLFDKNDNLGKRVFAAGVSGGLWKTNNISSSNPNWQPVNDFFGSLAICAIAQNPTNPNLMYFGTGEGYFESNSNPGMGIWMSSNGGVSWSHLNSTANQNFDFIQKIKVSPNGKVWVTTKTGLYTSTNNGATWQNVLSSGNGAISNNANDIEVISNSEVLVSFGIFNEDGIYKTIDGGSNWTRLTTGLPTSGYGRIELGMAPSNHNVCYALFEDSADSNCKGIYKTTNGGNSWTQVQNPSALGMPNFARSQAWYNLEIAVSPTNENDLFIGGIDLLKSEDGGTSWTQISHWTNGSPLQYMHADQHAMVFNPVNANELIIGNDGGVWRTSNAQDSEPLFSNRNLGYNITQFYGAAAHPTAGSNYFLAGAQDNGSHKFTSAGLNTTVEVSGGDGVHCFIDEDQPNIQITSYAYNNYFVSTDGGTNFNYLQLNNFGFFANANCYDSDQNILYASSSEGNILRWKNPESGIASFQHIIVTALNGRKASYLKLSPNVPNRLYVGTEDGDLMLIDNVHHGIFASATILRDQNFGFVSGIDIEKGNENHVVVSYSNYGMASIFESSDGGSTWLDLDTNLPDIPVRHILLNPLNPSQIFAATELGIWSSDENRSSSIQWSPASIGMANVRVDQLSYRASDQLLVAATHGRGLYTTHLQFSTVPVEWVNFELTYQSHKDAVLVHWETASELNLDHFVIQKSFDGEVWDELSEVNAKYLEGGSYAYLDDELYLDKTHYYYRIKSLDLDGSFEFSEVRSLFVEKERTNVKPEFYPNPFDQTINLGNANLFEEIEIIDLSGRILLRIQTPTETLDLSQLPDGPYLLIYKSKEGQKGLEKVVKQSRGEEEE